jgi:hypothetical protein
VIFDFDVFVFLCIESIADSADSQEDAVQSNNVTMCDGEQFDHT